MNALAAVLRKELVDGIRDRRSVVSALMFPILLPLLLTFIFNKMIERDREAWEIEIPIVGAERAPDLVDWIQLQGYEVSEGPADPEAAVRAKVNDFVLVVPKEFVEDFRQARTAELELVYDGSRKELSQAIRRVRDLVRSYSRLVGNLRLVARGVSPLVGNAIAIDDVDLASARQRAANLLSFIPMIIILATFIAGVNVAIDTTAGERERHSLEPLLVNPVPRRTLTAGKWLAASIFSGAGFALTLASLLFALSRVPLQQIGIDLEIGTRETIGLLLSVLPLTLFASGLQVALATFARSYKEAQTYLSMLVILPMVPHFIASMTTLGDAWWMHLIPALGQHVLVTGVLGGEPFSIPLFLTATLSAVILGYACVEITARLFQREHIVFGS